MNKISKIIAILIFCHQCLFAQVPLLWGMTSTGGTNGDGTIFKIKGDGTNAVSLFSFDILITGTTPFSSFLNASNGKLYSLCEWGGLVNKGVLFSFDTTINSYTNLLNFSGTAGNYPTGNLIQASSGKLYGTAYDAGPNFFGTIYSFNPFNNVFNTLYGPTGIDGKKPMGTLVQVNNGKLYGITNSGGVSNFGTIFSFDTLSNLYTKIFDFSGSDGQNPTSGLTLANNGKLYGMTTLGGTSNGGVIYSLDPVTNMFVKLFDFTSINGKPSRNQLIKVNNGKLYGMTSAGGINNMGVIFSFDPQTNSYIKLFDFSSATGQSPYGDLYQASDGNLYGMTSSGGVNNLGTVFKYDILNNSYIDIFHFTSVFGGNPGGSLREMKGVDTGIKENYSSKFGLLIYPNPAAFNLSVFIPEGQKIKSIELINISGIVLESFSENTRQINVEKLEQGMYFIKVKNDSETLFYSKFIKQ